MLSTTFQSSSIGSAVALVFAKLAVVFITWRGIDVRVGQTTAGADRYMYSWEVWREM